jgi:hypothetical protein
MSFIDWWVPPTPLEPGETEVLAILANKCDAWRAVGGKLVATERRVIFRPGRVDRALGSREWSVPHTRIAEIGSSPRTWNPFNGGLRTRLRLVTDDRAEHLFVVNRLDEQIARLQQLR